MALVGWFVQQSPITYHHKFSADCEAGKELQPDGKCKSCSRGYYRTQNDDKCVSCGDVYTTEGEGTKSSDDCNISKLFHTGNFPKIWNESYISLIHKKGDKLNPNNYRRISITSNLGNLFNKIIHERLLNSLILIN